MTIEECRLASEKRWNNMDLELQKIKDDLKVMTARLDKQAKLVEDIQQLSLNVAALSQNMQQMLEEMKNQNLRLNTLEQKPMKRWDSILDTIIKLVISAGVGVLLVKIGLQ